MGSLDLRKYKFEYLSHALRSRSKYTEFRAKIRLRDTIYLVIHLRKVGIVVMSCGFFSERLWYSKLFEVFAASNVIFSVGRLFTETTMSLVTTAPNGFNLSLKKGLKKTTKIP